MLDLRPVKERSPLDGKLRAFIALSPPAEWREALAEWMRVEQRRFSSDFGKWTTAEKAHLTLRFLGTITQRDVLMLEESLAEVAKGSEPFDLWVNGLGCFPNVERARVLWLGFENDANLLSLAVTVYGTTVSIGQELEAREFTPHLTLARIASAHGIDRTTLRWLIQEGTPELPKWPVTELELIKSELGKGGSTYTRLAAFKLGA